MCFRGGYCRHNELLGAESNVWRFKVGTAKTLRNGIGAEALYGAFVHPIGLAAIVDVIVTPSRRLGGYSGK